jgi:hypothetical protein
VRWQTAVGLLALGVIACGATETLPPELLGTWRTDNPVLRESYFELREGWVVFGADRYRASMHPIRSVASTRSGGSTEYDIEYTDEDGAFLPLHLVYTPGSPPRLRVGQRPDAWVPESAAHWLKEEPS